MELEWLIFFFSLLALGCAAGFLAGLLGIGGGIIMVPALYYVFSFMGFEPSVLMHMAVGTSLAVIVPTSLLSSMAHLKADNVRIDLVKTIGVGILVGVVIGTMLADISTGKMLKAFFAVALAVISIMMLLPPHILQQSGDGPAQSRSVIAGVVIGVISTLMGIGGASMNVPFMTLHGVSIHKAVGTAACVGPFIAIPAFIGFMLIGQGEESLPAYSLGYVHLLSFAVLAPFSMLCVNIGARTGHAMPKETLRRVFVAVMILISLKMMHGALMDG